MLNVRKVKLIGTVDFRDKDVEIISLHIRFLLNDEVHFADLTRTKINTPMNRADYWIMSRIVSEEDQHENIIDDLGSIKANKIKKMILEKGRLAIMFATI